MRILATKIAKGDVEHIFCKMKNDARRHGYGISEESATAFVISNPDGEQCNQISYSNSNITEEVKTL